MKRTMVFLIAIIFILPILMCACGEDGDDGSSYISLNYVSRPLSFYTDDPGVPNTFYYFEDYQSSAGEYYFEYTAWDGSGWYGWYNISVDKGEDGDLFTDGDDGEDRYFELWLYSFGPSFYSSEMTSVEEEIVVSKGIIVNDDIGDLYQEQSQVMSIMEESDSELKVIEKRQGRYHMRIEYQRIIE